MILWHITVPNMNIICEHIRNKILVPVSALPLFGPFSGPPVVCPSVGPHNDGFACLSTTPETKLFKWIQQKHQVSPSQAAKSG